MNVWAMYGDVRRMDLAALALVDNHVAIVVNGGSPIEKKKPGIL